MKIPYRCGTIAGQITKIVKRSPLIFRAKNVRILSSLNTICYSQMSHECPMEEKALDGNIKKMADGVGFEPTERSHVRRFSRPVPSTARPPIHVLHQV